MLFANVFFTMLFLHALADYPLQGDFLARAKNRAEPIPGVPWWQAMAAHTTIHAGFVFFATGSLVLAAAEMLIHWVVDDQKCRGLIGFNGDQILHVTCKALWAFCFVVANSYGVQLP